ncbi:metal-dependent hydrolase, partial [Cysteiniphilum marinum]
MANFKTHITVAAFASFVPSVGLYLSGISVSQTLLLTFIGSIGGILPDIDSENSTSKSIVFKLSSLALALLWLFTSLPQFGLIFSIINSIVIYLLMYFPIKSLLSKISYHRGVIHSVPMAILMAIALYFIMHLITKDLYISWLVGIFLFYGYIIHLLLDELYSVDFSGARLKKSFGTALTFFNKEKWIIYVLLYALIAAIYFSLPEKFNLIQFSKLLVDNFSQNMLNNLLPTFW